MDTELQDYVESLKLSSIHTKDIKNNILKVKKRIDKLFKLYEPEIKSGELTKQQIIEEFLDEFFSGKDSKFQGKTTFSFAHYDACKKIIKMGKANRIGLNAFINEAKRRNKLNPEETLCDTIDMKEEMIVVLRRAIRNIIVARKRRGITDFSNIKPDEILASVYSTRERLSDEIKNKLIISLQDKIIFFEQYGFLDEYIDESNRALVAAGLSEIQVEKRNPLPDIRYDENGNEVPPEEYEDMGVIDYFESSQLKQLSPEELFVLEMFWKSKYFNAKIETSEALAIIDYLGLWDTITNGNESAVEKLDEETLRNGLKRDLALTYLVRDARAVTPELKERYLQFLKQNGMPVTENIMEEIQNHTRILREGMEIANDVILGECVLVDKLANKELDAKNWGLVREEKELESEKLIIGAEIPNFRGTFVFSIGKKAINDFLQLKSKSENARPIKIPKYKEKLDENYDVAMSNMLLPISAYFKKIIDKKYQGNPSSPLLSHLALKFAGSKKVKGTKIKEDRER